MKEYKRGGGEPIGEPYRISQTREGNRERRSQRRSSRSHASASYGVGIRKRSVTSTLRGAVIRATERADVGTMSVGRGVIPTAVEVEADTDLSSVLGGEAPMVMLDDELAAGYLGSCGAAVGGTVTLGAAAETEVDLLSTKGLVVGMVARRSELADRASGRVVGGISHDGCVGRDSSGYTRETNFRCV